MSSFKWDSGVARYRDAGTGRFLSQERVAGLINESLAASRDVVSALGELVADGTLSAADWQAQMRQELKEEYIRQYLAGRGGRAAMDSADWGRVGGMLKEQYDYLSRFTAQIEEGNLTGGQIKMRGSKDIRRQEAKEPRSQEGWAKAARMGAYEPWIETMANAFRVSSEQIAYWVPMLEGEKKRARMYVSSAREAFHRAEGVGKDVAGYDEELWVVDPALENCEDCLALAAMGYVPLGTHPQPGQGKTRCMTNCGCRKTYRKSTE